MSFNIRGYVSDDHIESIGEIAKSQSAIIQALSLENSKLKSQLQQEENIRKEIREYIMTELITEWDIENGGHVSGSDLPAYAITPILEILDKGSDKE